MMQVLCKPSPESDDVKCPVCGQGFLLYWERTSPELREMTRPDVERALREHHELALEHPGEAIHPGSAFNIPSWSGQPQFSAAALLGGAAF